MTTEAAHVGYLLRLAALECNVELRAATATAIARRLLRLLHEQP